MTDFSKIQPFERFTDNATAVLFNAIAVLHANGLMTEAEKDGAIRKVIAKAFWPENNSAQGSEL